MDLVKDRRAIPPALSRLARGGVHIPDHCPLATRKGPPPSPRRSPKARGFRGPHAGLGLHRVVLPTPRGLVEAPGGGDRRVNRLF